MALDFLHGIEVLEISDGIRPIQTVRSAVIGLIGTAPGASAEAFPLNQPVLVVTRREAAKLDVSENQDGGGTLKTAVDGIFDQSGAVVVVIRVEEDVDAAVTLTNVIGGVDGVSDEYVGMHRFLDAETLLGVTPRLLIAPGFSQAATVTAELISLAPKLRAITVIDGPNTTDADAKALRATLGSDRAYLVDPWVTVGGIEEPPSARVAGMFARMDAERGFWWSPSNQVIEGITGTARPIPYLAGDTTSRANLLNEDNVTTIIRRNGWRLHGNHGLGDDPQWRFISVRRTADMVYESVEQALQWAMDRPFSPQLLIDIKESVAEYLRSLQARGAIIGFKVWIDPELNSAADLMAGKLTIDFDIEPPAPLERLTFRAHRNAGYYEELVAEAA